MRKSVYVLALLLLANFAGADSVIPKTRDSKTRFSEKVFMPYIEKGICPGAICILYNNGVQEVACMGWANMEKKIPISMDSTFMICSQTKGFCGVCIAMLIEEGKLSLDDPVSKYLPEFANLKLASRQKDGSVVLRPAKKVLTVRHVMSHTGGFPFETVVKSVLGWPSCPLRANALVAANTPLLFEPGTATRYSNTGIDIGAAIIEVITGKSFDRFLKERVLDPLGMKDTTFNPTDEQLARSISLYLIRKNQKARWMAFNRAMPLPHNGPNIFPSAGAGLWSTGNDLVKFYKMLMFEGMGENGVRILKEETVRNILATNQRPKGTQGAYSLGLNASRSDQWFGHGGAWGTRCSVNGMKNQLKFMVVQLNGGPRPWDNAWEKAADAFFSEKIEDSGVKAYTGRMK